MAPQCFGKRGCCTARRGDSYPHDGLRRARAPRLPLRPPRALAPVPGYPVAAVGHRRGRSWTRTRLGPVLLPLRRKQTVGLACTSTGVNAGTQLIRATGAPLAGHQSRKRNNGPGLPGVPADHHGGRPSATVADPNLDQRTLPGPPGATPARGLLNAALAPSCPYARTRRPPRAR